MTAPSTPVEVDLRAEFRDAVSASAETTFAPVEASDECTSDEVLGRRCLSVLEAAGSVCCDVSWLAEMEVSVTSVSRGAATVVAVDRGELNRDMLDVADGELGCATGCVTAGATVAGVVCLRLCDCDIPRKRSNSSCSSNAAKSETTTHSMSNSNDEHTGRV